MKVGGLLEYLNMVGRVDGWFVGWAEKPISPKGEVIQKHNEQ